MKLTLRAWRGIDAFAALAPVWERCAEAAELDPLCNAHAWTLAHARAFSQEHDVFGWVLEAGGEGVGVLALRRERGGSFLALRRALFLADGTFDSDYLEPPLVPGLERDFARLLVDGEVDGIEALVLAGMPEGSRVLAALRAELAARGLPRRELVVPCLAAPLAGSFEAYLATLKPRMRTKVRGAARDAEARGARLEWCRAPQELDAHLAELYRLHELRWRAEGRAGSFADPRRRAFTHAFSTTALARGTLRLARLVEGDLPVAVQLGVVHGPRYYQIQEGFDPAREDQRVGVALRALAIRALIAEGVRAYDFMAGDSTHKRDWGGAPRPCVTIAFPLPRWRARLAYRLRERVDRWRARSTPPPS